VNLNENFALFCLGGLFEQVSDLRGLEPPDPAERPAQQRTARVPDQRLEIRPVLEVVRPGIDRADQPHQPAGTAVGVDSGKHPVPVQAAQFEVGSLDQVRARHVDQAVPEHVGAQQHLAIAPLELTQVEHRAGQPERLAVERTHLLERNEDRATAHRGHQADHEWVLGTAQPHDDIVELADRFTALVRDRTAHQLGQVQHPPATRLRRRGRR
jgi:hypothetical protein